MQLVGYSSSTSSRTKNVDRTLIGCQAILSTNVNDDSQAEQADEDLLSKQLEKLWDLEALGIRPSEFVDTNSNIIENFHRTTRFENG